MGNKKLDWKLVIGIIISLVFLYLAFRKVDFSRMWQAFATANYIYLIPIFAVMLLSLLLRVWRWRYLLAPLGNVKNGDLFSALMIGYMANIFIPAHLGELLRAFVIGRKSPISSGAVFATIVVERIIDVYSFLLVMAFTIVVFPFPDWVQKSGYITLILILILTAILVLMKNSHSRSLHLLDTTTRFLPAKTGQLVIKIGNSFLEGVKPLQNWRHYILVFIFTILMWFCYAFIFHLAFFAFDFIRLYSLPWYASLVLLVLTTISIAVPSSPGYVGTYHYLCQIGLSEFFNVPLDAALSFAFLAHGLNTFTMLIVGLICASREGLSLKSLNKKPPLQ